MVFLGSIWVRFTTYSHRGCANRRGSGSLPSGAKFIFVWFACWFSRIDFDKLSCLQLGNMTPQTGRFDPVLLCGRLWENKITFSTAFHSHAKVKVSGPDTKGTKLRRQHQSISNLNKSFFVVARLGRQPGNNRGFGSSFGHIMFLSLCGECGQRA